MIMIRQMNRHITGKELLCIEDYSYTHVNPHRKHSAQESMCYTERTAQCVQSWREPCEWEVMLVKETRGEVFYFHCNAHICLNKR